LIQLPGVFVIPVIARKTFKIIISILSCFVLTAGCKSEVDVKTTRNIIALYDAPKIIVSYNEAVSIGGLSIDRYNQNVSKQEFVEIYNLLRTIKDDPKSKELGIWTFDLQNLYIQKKTNGYFTVMTHVIYEGPTYAGGQILTFNRWYDGRYEFVSIGRWVS
jgi:hypothetical protein